LRRRGSRPRVDGTASTGNSGACGIPKCTASHRTCVIELGDCEAAGADEEDGAVAKDNGEPDNLECLHCKPERIEAKHAQVRRQSALQERPGVTLPNGLIITGELSPQNLELMKMHTGQDVKLYEFASARFTAAGRRHGLDW
jgi:hypothetical protein